MKYYKKLVGDRIYLSPVSIEDAEKYVEWFCDFSMTDGVGRSSALMTVEMEKEWLENALKKENYSFAIVNAETNELIGNCDLENINPIDRRGTVGIFIGREENRSQGYGSEALRLILDFGFRYLNLHNIMLNVKSFNERAIACYQKVGFKEFGRRRESYFLNGKYYDDVQMDILESEFEGDFIRNKNV